MKLVQPEPAVFQISNQHLKPLSDSNHAEELQSALDSALSIDPRQGMQLMKIALYQVHQRVSNQEWRKLVSDVILNHPIGKICHKDPFTHRAFSKPRGYAGDAVMIDYIYGYFDDAELSDPEAALANEFVINSPSDRAVRNRLNFMANKLSALARQNDKPEILSVASGHCREFGLCAPLHCAGSRRRVGSASTKRIRATRRYTRPGISIYFTQKPHTRRKV